MKSMNSLFNINLKCILLTSRIELNKRYVLTLTEAEWDPPIIHLNHSFDINKINQELIASMKKLVFVNDIELIPQIISVKKNNEAENTLDIIYGFVINYTNSLSECFWLEFDLLKETNYSQTLLEVIQKLT